MRTFAILMATLAMTPALAQDGLRASDVVMAPAELTETLSGQQLEFFDGSKSSYAEDGTYGYTYTDDGPVWTGRFEVFEESRVCVDFDNGSRRCDQLVRDGDRLVLITEDGLRFPVRNRTVYQR